MCACVHEYVVVFLLCFCCVVITIIITNTITSLGEGWWVCMRECVFVLCVCVCLFACVYTSMSACACACARVFERMCGAHVWCMCDLQKRRGELAGLGVGLVELNKCWE